MQVRRKMEKFEKLISYVSSTHLISRQKWESIHEMNTVATESLGMISASEVISDVDVPGRNRSAVDGYALSSRYTGGAGGSDPVIFKIVGRSSAGIPFSRTVKRGECVEIYTGAAIPDGTDTVIMVEDVSLRDGIVEISSPAPPGMNIIKRGDEIRKGQVILGKGEIIKPWHISSLLSCGIKKIKVYKRIKVGILSTGDELFPESDEMVENTTSMVISYILHSNFVHTFIFPPVHDDSREIARAVLSNLSRSDIFIISGGSSLGGMDNVPEAMDQINARALFGGVRASPGRTTSVYSLHGKMILSVSGFPMTAMIMADLYVENMLRTLCNLRGYRTLTEMEVDGNVNGKPGYVKLVPASITSGACRKVHPLGSRHGIKMSEMLGSDCLIIVPENIEGYKAGDKVMCRLW